MVEVFKTNVPGSDEAELVIQKLLAHLPGSLINFDLDDCDKILRVEGPDICIEKIINVITATGYHIEVLK